MTTPGSYSAGTIFLQVIPSYRDFMNSLRRDARDIEKALKGELEKAMDSGKPLQSPLASPKAKKANKQAAREQAEEAATEYAGAFRTKLQNSLRRAQRELAPIELKGDSKKLEATLKRVSRQVDALSELAEDVDIDIDGAEAVAELKIIRRDLERLQRAAKDIEVELNLDESIKGLSQLEQAVDRIADARSKAAREAADAAAKQSKAERAAMEEEAAWLNQIHDIEKRGERARADAHTKRMADMHEEALRLNRNIDLERKAAAARRAMREGRSLTDARAAAAQAASGLGEAGPVAGIKRKLSDVSVDLDLNGAAFFAELEAAAKELDRVARDRTVDINVRLDAKNAAAKIRRTVADAEGSGRGGGGMGDAASNLRAFNARILTAVAIGPLLIPILASLGAAALAMGAAFSAAAAGLGVMILGFSGISDAVTAINDFEKDNAKQQRARDKAVRSAARGVRDAERSVAQARQAASRAAEDAADRIEGAARRQEQAEESLRDAQRDALRAQERLTRARAEAEDQLEDMALRARGGALAERQALIDLFEAEVAYRNAMADGGATNKEREQASINLERERLGIEQIRLENARLAEEQGEVARTGIEGMDSVVAAREGVEAADERLRDAEREVADAAQAMQRAQIDGAQAVQRANEEVADSLVRLSDAQQDYQDALIETTAAQDKLNEAMAALGPAGQAFALFIASLKDEFRSMRDATQAGLLPGVEDAIRTLLPFLPAINEFLFTMGQAIGDLIHRFAHFLTESPAMLAFFSMMADMGPTFMTLWAEIGMALIELFAVLATAFAPFAEEMLTGLLNLLTGWSEFLQTEAGQQMMQDFMDYVREVGPQVISFLGALFRALGNLGEALAPYAGLLLTGLTEFLDFIAGMDPNVLAAVTLAILGMVFAFQALAGVVGMLGSVVTLLSVFGVGGGAAAGGAAAGAGAAAGGVGLGAIATFLGIAAAVIGLGAALVVAYFKVEWFRDGVNAAFNAIWEVVKFVFNLIWEIVKIVFAGIKWYWEHVLLPVFKVIVWWVEFIWDVWATVFAIIGALFGKAVDKILERWNAFLASPGGQMLVSFWQDTVQPAWESFIDFVGEMWERIKSKFHGGIDIIVGFINDGIIDPINSVADALGVDNKIARLDNPLKSEPTRTSDDRRANLGGSTKTFRRQSFAAGGPVGGYSPTPTADNIPAMLTAGEYVLPVAAVRALRSKFGDQFLEMLRHGLPGFAQGGLVEFGRLLQGRGFRVAEHPAFGGVRGAHSKNSYHYSGQAIDVNWAAGTSPAEQRALAAIIPLAREYGLRSIFMAPGHYGHAHFDTGGARGSIIGSIASVAGSAWDGVKGGASWLKDKAGQVVSPLRWMMNKALDFSGIDALRSTTLGRAVLDGGMGLLRDGISWLRNTAGDSLGDFFSFGNGDGDQDDPNLKLYDSGGWLPPGLTTVLNASGRPEPVLTADQWDMIEAGAIAGAGGDTFHIPVTQQNDPGAVADAIRFSQRHLRRGGVYAGRG